MSEGLLLTFIKAKQIMQTTTSTSTTTTTTPKVFTNWSSCGQTFSQPSIDPFSLVVRRTKRIIGGEDAIKHSWPFLVSIRIKIKGQTKHHCGGTLFTDQHVLTAAHCFIAYFKLLSSLNLSLNQVFTLIEVHVGLNEHEPIDPKYSSSEHVYAVEYFELHEDFDFNEWTLEHDIAIIKLKRKVNLQRPEVNVVCLPQHDSSYKVKSGENAVAIGWGSYAEDFNHTAYVRDSLQQAVFTIHDQNDQICNTGMIGNKWNKNFTICAGGQTKKKVTCFGDSGGPVLAYRRDRWYLIGIISFAHDIKEENSNKKKCNASMPFYFVKVKAYYEWINQKTEYVLNSFQ
jgi:secreted trypsin-like serine protease